MWRRAPVRGSIRWSELLAPAGDSAAARAAIGTIQDELYRGMALNRVTAARAAAGDVAGALRLAVKATPTGRERREALQGIGEGIAVRRQLESVVKPAR